MFCTVKGISGIRIKCAPPAVPVEDGSFDDGADDGVKPGSVATPRADADAANVGHAFEGIGGCDRLPMLDVTAGRSGPRAAPS